MGDIVNLRRVRKAMHRAADAAEATANRRKHGMTRAERDAAERERATLARPLDQAKVERD